jgi:hypothetical protein
MEWVYSIEPMTTEGGPEWGVPHRKEIAPEPGRFILKLKPDPRLPKRHGAQIKAVGSYREARGRAWCREVTIKNTLEGRALVAELLREYGFEDGTDIEMRGLTWFLRCKIKAYAADGIKGVMRQWKEFLEERTVTDRVAARQDAVVLKEPRSEFEANEKADEEERARNRARAVALAFAASRLRAAEFANGATWKEGDLGILQSTLWDAAGVRPKRDCQQCEGFGVDRDYDLIMPRECRCLKEE